MSRLFSYCLRYDNGVAPNPFWGLCTLAICKPRIRRATQIGDWIVGTGSAASPVGNVSNAVVYAMCVIQKMTMQDYDRFTQVELPDKISHVKSADRRRKVVDSIYDFSKLIPSLRPGGHGEGNRKTDLSGGWVLLSDYFFYFGDRPVALPEALYGIVKHGRGHKSISNAPSVEDFARWIEGLGYPPGSIVGKPQQWRRSSHQVPSGNCTTDKQQEVEAGQAEESLPCGSNRCSSFRHDCCAGAINL